MPDQIVILTAIGSRDRPGIIAALTRAILEVGGNLDDATMTRLHGAFATMIAAKLDEGSISDLSDKLDTLAPSLGVHLSLERIALSEDSLESHGGPDHIINVYGADHPGIVHHVALLLEAHEVNITDLETRLTGGASSPIYVMMVETCGGDWNLLPDALRELGRRLEIDVSFSAIDEETL